MFTVRLVLHEFNVSCRMNISSKSIYLYCFIKLDHKPHFNNLDRYKLAFIFTPKAGRTYISVHHPLQSHLHFLLVSTLPRISSSSAMPKSEKLIFSIHTLNVGSVSTLGTFNFADTGRRVL